MPNGNYLSNSVENENYYLKLVEAFGLPVDKAEIQTFGKIGVLVIERLDRRWAKDGRLLRRPQEDCCQALSITASQEYQSDGGLNLVQVLDLLKGSDKPSEDQESVFKAQILFWLIGETDGRAKNFSVFIGQGGSYSLTPLYDVVTAQPRLDSGQIARKQMRPAMSVGKERHYRLSEILGRHFVQTGQAAGLPKSLVKDVIESVADGTRTAHETIERSLPKNFPEEIHTSVSTAMKARLGGLTVVQAV